ncbi:alpha/beta hydrolase [Emticicia aquatilis]|uniref:Alpha/beta hydrolase n=1 Tax=Emticicia aquatilis TaxID=1537369 RepID=A0A916YK37_9BACT|nr:alpha/beta hydrolase [Emticicia aquatilis]GGD49087.1 alpha/beta hydrolase [Emticicia aquatilis]
MNQVLKCIITALILSIPYYSIFAQYKHDSVKIEHGYLHYYTKGKGDAIVFLQGGPGFSSYYMRGIADSLNNNMCILIDYEGTGRSQKRKSDSSWVSPEKIVSDIEQVRKKLAINKWTIIGHSYGTHFGLLYASKYPAMVRKIVLLAFIGTNNQFQRYSWDNISIRLSETDMEQLQIIEKDTLLSGPDREFRTQSIILKAYFFDKSKVVPFLKSVPNDENEFYYNDSFNYAYWLNKNYWKWDISNDALKLEIPIRIIQGRQDFVNDGNQSIFDSKAKNSKLYYIEQSGHFSWLERPSVFFEILRKELKEM